MTRTLLLALLGLALLAPTASAHYLYASQARSALKGSPGDNEVYSLTSGYKYSYTWAPDCYHPNGNAHVVRCTISVYRPFSGQTDHYRTESWYPNSSITVYDKVLFTY